jgi:hypothetical protein
VSLPHLFSCANLTVSLYTYRERGHSKYDYKGTCLQACGTSNVFCPFKYRTCTPPNEVTQPPTLTHIHYYYQPTMGFGIFGNTSSSKHHQPPSWTSGSFPGAPAVHFVSTPGYSYAAYSPVPTVWPVQQQQQQQTFVAVSPYPVQQLQVPVQVPVPVQVAQPMTVVSPTTFMQTQSPTVTVLQQQHTVTTTPGTNMLHLCDHVPSPKISHVIPYRSPRSQPPPLESVQECLLVPAQPQQQQQQQQVYSQQVYSQQPQQQQQQQQPSPVVFHLNIVSPQQVQSPLPALGPGPSRSPRSGFVPPPPLPAEE